MGRYRGLDTGEGWIQRRFAGLDAQLREISAARRLVIASDWTQQDINTMDLTTTFDDYLVTTIAQPDGYTSAIIQVSASAGSTLASTNSGNIGVQPNATGAPGPALSQGKTAGGAVSISSHLSVKVPLVVGVALEVWLSAYANGGPYTSGAGNVHLSATILFTRD